MITKAGEIVEVAVGNKADFVVAAAKIKKTGGKIIKASIVVSDTIVIGYTNVIKNCA